jgi:hypothetical protein
VIYLVGRLLESGKKGPPQIFDTTHFTEKELEGGMGEDLDNKLKDRHKDNIWRIK